MSSDHSTDIPGLVTLLPSEQDSFFSFGDDYTLPSQHPKFRQNGFTEPPAKANHRRSQSLNSYLPNHIAKLIETDLEASLERYDQLIETHKPNEARAVLKELIKNCSNAKDKYRIYRSAADSNKRRFLNKEAFDLYTRAESIDPTAPQCYLDHAKLLDEIGKSDEAEEVLKKGLVQTHFSDQITVKLLKQFERRQRFSSARQILGQIYLNMHSKGAPASVAEGILFEVRHGDVENALHLLSLIDQKTISKSGFFVELSEYLHRRGYNELSLSYARLGTQRNITMPNNWNQLLQLQTSEADIINTLNKAKENLSQNTLSKLIQATALLLASRYNSLTISRIHMGECLLLVSPDQRWRVFYNAAIIEMFYGDRNLSKLLLDQSFHISPQKYASIVLLACAKVAEINNDKNAKLALEYYNRLYKNYNSDWRVYLEYSMYLIRHNKIRKALELVKEGLKKHSSTGRLWALRIQLEDGNEQIETLKEAIKNTPKSGEVWVEAVRIVLNPLSPYFNLKNARFFLNVAFLFTPQYIDIFIEMIRLELLENGFNCDLDKIRRLFVSGDGNYGTVFYMFRKPGFEFTDKEFDIIVDGIKADLKLQRKLYSRAIARSSFVVENVAKTEELMKKDQMKNNSFQFAFGLTSFLDKMRNKNEIKENVAIILGSSGALV
ncbi:pre-mRNA splicing factor [Histomonas meleagridis]|uniref:pre-mRNA splicing factor n=1 Tax=Histomonas meleagridis TaxID=135588 RepID=UPI00355A5491|nr:pre-mRNA splicing factor [Histomonas meleagridis]KAH0806309.1 pre-mRNA splicing factor [Histomonas meleagridis]